MPGSLKSSGGVVPISPLDLNLWRREQRAHHRRVAAGRLARRNYEKRLNRERLERNRKVRAANRLRKKEEGRKGAVTARRSKILLDKLEQKNFHVLNELINLYQRVGQPGVLDTTRDQIELQYKILSQLLGYCYPKLRSMEVKGDSGKATMININIPAPVEQTSPIKVNPAPIGITHDVEVEEK